MQNYFSSYSNHWIAGEKNKLVTIIWAVAMAEKITQHHEKLCIFPYKIQNSQK